MTHALAALALGFAGFFVWVHGYSRGLHYNNGALYHASRKVVESRRQVRELRAQVAILEAGMLRAPVDMWADFNRERPL